MNTAEIKINTHGVGMEEALSATEKLGLDCGLSHKENLRLRLLAEELIGLMRGITGNVEAVYRASREEKRSCWLPPPAGRIRRPGASWGRSGR